MDRRDRKPTYLRSAPSRRHGSRRGSHARPPARRSASRRGYAPPRRYRKSGPRALGLLLIVALLAAAAAGAWALTRPLTLTLAATPADATIRFAAAGQETTGTLTAENLRPGVYTIEVFRSGFATQAVEVEVERFGSNRFEVALDPLPWDVSVTTKPEGAACSITRDGAELLSGTSGLTGQVTAGPALLRITHDGYNVVEHELYIEGPTSLEIWLDPEGQVLRGMRTIVTLGAPKGVSVTPDGSEAWTSILNGPPSIEIFDPRTGAKIGEVDIGTHGAVEVIFNKAGTLAYTSQMETAKCFEIDVKTRKVVREFDTESAWTKWVGLSPDERTLYASNWSGDDVSIINLTTGELMQRVRVSNTPRGMYATADGVSLYVAGFDSGHLERIDLATGEVTKVYTEGGALRHIVGDETTGRLFISDMARNVVLVHDMRAGTTAKFVDTDQKPNTIDLTPDGKMLFVSCRGANNPVSYYIPGPEWGSILVFDTSNGAPLDAVVAGNQPTALDVSDDGNLLVFSDFLDNRLRVYEIPPYEEFVSGGGGRFEAHFAEVKK
ncbi:MAG: YncE family protein [Coriobacteriia bacterium]|nr:YncE family protein [Coriobacteriia bacterium]